MIRWTICAIAILAAPAIQAQADDAKASAKESLMRCLESVDPVHQPFVTLSDVGLMVLDGSPGPFDGGWRTDLGIRDGFRLRSTPAISPDQVHFIGRGRAQRHYFVVTKREGAWAAQFHATLSNLKPNTESIRAAQSTLDSFFTAWNAADNEAIHRHVNFPHVFLTREGRASVAEKPDDLITDFDGMRQREGWAKSEYHGFDVIHSDVAKVIAKLAFTRHHDDGAIYQTVPVVWIFTNDGGHWGLQVRCILPASQQE
jgi:hypothetical protein